MRIAVAASPKVAIPTLEAIKASSHELVRVFSQPDRPAGRGRVMEATPVSQWAQANDVELFRPEKASELAALIEDVDCVVTIGYGLLIPEDVLAIPRYGFLNIHFSILPRWRGAAPVQRAIEAGDSVSGITVFQLDKGMDTGPYYVLSRFALDSDITSDELLEELGELAPVSLMEALELIQSGDKPKPQAQTEATRAYKLTREEGQVDLLQSAEIVSAKIRAFTSNPGAWITFRGSVMKVTLDSITELQLTPGELRNVDGKLLLGTGTKAISIATVTPAGKSSLPASAWLNGARLVDGERCE
jgi:methionyl-tRNA formyltransferase